MDVYERCVLCGDSAMDAAIERRLLCGAKGTDLKRHTNRHNTSENYADGFDGKVFEKNVFNKY